MSHEPARIESLFTRLGRLAGPAARRATWVYRSFAGTPEEAVGAEYAAGCDLARSVIEQLGIDPEAEAATRRLDEILGRLAAELRPPRRRFSVRIVRSPAPNAFALPGGFLFVTRPLIDLQAWDPAEAAFLLGHEIGHVVRGHALDRMLTSTFINAASQLIPVRGALRPYVASFLSELLQKGYSRDQELEADTTGVRLARQAGFDPEGAVRLLTALGGHTTGNRGPLPFLASHPPLDERVRHIRRSVTRRS